MQPRQAIGIRQLAAALGLSIGTVSRALNGRADVNHDTRARVLEAAQRLGYAANHSGGIAGLGDCVSDERDCKQQKNSANRLVPNHARRPRNFRNDMLRKSLRVSKLNGAR